MIEHPVLHDLHRPGRDSIYKDLREAISRGSFLPTGRLPSVRGICAHYGASANTVANAIGRLVESGLCEVRPGVGVFITREAQRAIRVVGGGALAEAIAEGLSSRGGMCRIDAHLPATGGWREADLVVVVDPDDALRVAEFAAVRESCTLATVVVAGAPPAVPALLVGIDWFRAGYRAARTMALAGSPCTGVAGSGPGAAMAQAQVHAGAAYAARELGHRPPLPPGQAASGACPLTVATALDQEPAVRGGLAAASAVPALLAQVQIAAVEALRHPGEGSRTWLVELPEAGA